MVKFYYTRILLEPGARQLLSGCASHCPVYFLLRKLTIPWNPAISLEEREQSQGIVDPEREGTWPLRLNHKAWITQMSSGLAWVLVCSFYLVIMGIPDFFVPWPSQTLCHPCPLALFSFPGPELLLWKLWESADQLNQLSTAHICLCTSCFHLNTQHSPNPPPRRPHLTL